MNSDVHCANLIREANKIAVLTGAGISTKAGIPDFRGPEGLYVTKRYDPDTVFNIDCFYRDPKPFFDFARDFIKLESTLKPTFAHNFFADLEHSGKLIGVITQNIDSLHQMAGNKKVLELHGSFLKSHCINCGDACLWDEFKEKLFKENIPRCHCAGVIKPDIVFFGENVQYLNEAQAMAEKADLFFVVGSSCSVYPAAMLPQLAIGAIAIINLTKVELPIFNVALNVQEDIDDFLTQVQEYLQKEVI